MYATVYSGDPATALDQQQMMQPGTIVAVPDDDYGWTLWKYVQFVAEATNTALATHQPLYYDDVAHTQVTGVMAEALSNSVNHSAGFYQGPAVTAANIVGVEGRYMFIQVGGKGLVLMNNDDDADVGMSIIGVTGGVCNTVPVDDATTGLSTILGWVLVAVDAASNYCWAWITIEMNGGGP